MSTTISASLVKELRDATGAPMMDCKRALEETGGDLEAARTLLRERGMAQAAKRAGRATTEGLVGYRIEGDTRHDGRRRLRDGAGLQERGVPGVREERARGRRTPRVPTPSSRSSRTASTSVREARREHRHRRRRALRGRRGRGRQRLHAPAGEQDRRARQARRAAARSSRASWRCTSRSRRPSGLSKEDVPAETVEAEKQVYLNSDELEGKPEQAKEKIVEGMLAKRFFAAAAGRRAHRAAVDPRLGEDGGSGAQPRRERVSSRSSASLSQNRRVTTQEELAERAPSGTAPAFRRVLLKLSGEALMGDHEYGIDPKTRRRDRARDRRRCSPRGSSSRSSSAAATSTAASPPRPRGWTARRRTTRACSPRS